MLDTSVAGRQHLQRHFEADGGRVEAGEGLGHLNVPIVAQASPRARATRRGEGGAAGAPRRPNKPARPRQAGIEAQPRSHESTLFKTHRDEFKLPRSKGRCQR